MAGKRDKLFDSSEVSYSSQILCGLNDFRKQGILCDVSITVQGDRTFLAHRIVLAASSQYFRSLFTFNSQPKASFDHEVHLEWLCPEAMEIILDYIYSGKINLRQDNTEVIMTAATYFVIEGLPEAVIQFLQERLNLVNCFSVLSLADEHCLQELKSSCTRFISANFVHASNSPAFLSLQESLLIEVISSDNLLSVSDEDIFHTIVRWVSDDLKNRACYFMDLFSYIRLQGMPKDFLLNTVANEALVQQNTACIARVQEALCLAALEDEGEMHTGLTSTSLVEHVNAIVICGGTSNKYVIENLKHVACYVPSVNEWFDLQVMPCGQKGHSTAVCNNVLYSMGNHSVFNQESSRVVQCFDPGNNTWMPRASMPVGRCFAGAVTIQGQVYVLGGYLHKDDFQRVSAEISRYNPALDKWFAVTSMNCAREGLCACVLGENIYAIGGCDPDGHYLTTVEQYEPLLDRWNKVSPMRKKRAFASAAVVNSQILVIGGRESKLDSGILSCCEMLDPVTGQWTLQPGRLNAARCAAGVCMFAGKVFVFGGEGEDEALNTVECWDDEERQWSIVTHLPFTASHVQAKVLCLPKTLTKS